MNRRLTMFIMPIILLIGTLVSCGDNPTPTPEPEPTPVSDLIDFDFNPTEDKNISVDMGETRQVQIAFKRSDYLSNVKSIEWSVEPESSNYIEITTITSDKMYCQFITKQITLDSKPAELKVTVTSKDETVIKEKTCYITIQDATNKPLVYDGSWYSYKKKGNISASTNYVFTATLTSNPNYTYFGMSNYAGTTPYFDIGYKDTNATVNVTKMSIYNGDTLRKELVFGEKTTKDADFWKYSNDLLVVKSGVIAINEKIVIECTITKNLSAGFWAYVGIH